MEISTLNNLIEELCPEFHRALQANCIKRIEKRRETKNEEDDNSTEDSISDLIIDVDKMNFKGTYTLRHLKAEFEEAMHSTQKLLGVVNKLHRAIGGNAIDYLLASLILTDEFMLTGDVYMIQEHDKDGFNPRQTRVVESQYEIDVQRRGETYLEVKCSEDSGEIATVKRRLPSAYNIAVEGLGNWHEKGNKSGERFLHRIVGLALKNQVNDAARRKGYNDYLLVPYEVDGFSLSKKLVVCEHRFDYDALNAAGYSVR